MGWGLLVSILSFFCLFLYLSGIVMCDVMLIGVFVQVRISCMRSIRSSEVICVVVCSMERVWLNYG